MSQGGVQRICWVCRVKGVVVACFFFSRTWWMKCAKQCLLLGMFFVFFFLCEDGQNRVKFSENIHQEPILNLPSWWCIFSRSSQKGGGLLTCALSTKVSRKHGSVRSTSGHYWYRSWRSDPNVGLGRWKSTSMRWKILEIFHDYPQMTQLKCNPRGKNSNIWVFPKIMVPPNHPF